MNCDILPVNIWIISLWLSMVGCLSSHLSRVGYFVHVFRPNCCSSFHFLPTPQIRLVPALGYVDALVNGGVKGEVQRVFEDSHQ